MSYDPPEWLLHERPGFRRLPLRGQQRALERYYREAREAARQTEKLSEKASAVHAKALAKMERLRVEISKANNSGADHA